MMQNVFMKTLRDKRIFTLGWSIGFLALSGLMVVFFPAMQLDGSLDTLLQNMPAAMQGFVGDLDNLKHFSTYLASQLFDIRGQILGGVMVIILALGLTASEEESGQMRTFLALPISRTSFYVQKWLAMLVIIAVTLAAMGLGILAFQPFIEESIDPGVLLGLLGMTWLLLAAMATIVFAVAMAVGIRSAALLAGILLVAGSFILTTFAAGVDWLKDYEFLSVYYYYPSIDIAKGMTQWNDIAVLSVLIAVPLVVGWAMFRHRDVR